MNTQAKSYSEIAGSESLKTSNHNISSVLSQIQDDGPAYGETEKPDNLIKLKTEKKPDSSETVDKNSLYNDLYTKGSYLTNDDLRGSATSNKIWLQLVLGLFIAIGIAFFMYELDTRANKIEALLSAYDGEVSNTVEPYKEESPTIVKLNEELALMKNELEQFRTNSIDEDKQVEKFSENNKVISNKIVSTLKNEMHTLKLELIQVDSEFNLGKNNYDVLQTTDEVAATDKVNEKISVMSWAVNLAALSNKAKVDEIVNRLSNDGLKPYVEEVTVKGQRVYRLSVVGFSKFEQAELFVLIAEEEYGMKGGWIRKVKNG